ncbi:MAG: dihydropteroate synthase, partial [Deltaproteobacteria bacterium]|nr:dihydropteroate synthase [Deltaproteobacteria bacterium]
MSAPPLRVLFAGVGGQGALTAARLLGEAALSAGADMINDISALRFDADMARLAAERKVPVVLMHMQGDPTTMQSHPTYDDCVREITAFFAERIQHATAAGIERGKLILDPGIGFGKRPEDNLAILARLDEFIRFHLPLLVGASRKS